jgi:pimeloyl-ACP methyl ester carboxylesterase
MFRTLSQQSVGMPAIVYLPGIDGSGALVSQFLVKAENTFPLIRLHYPGHCRMSLEELADGCVAALAERDQTGVIWLGDSFGSAVALSIASRHPQVTKGLILAGGFSKGPNPLRLLLLARAWDSAPVQWRKKIVRNRLSRLSRRSPSKISGSCVDEVVSNGHLDYVSWRLRLISAFDVRDSLSSLSTPVLYLGGEDDGIVHTVEESKLFREKVRECRTFLFPGCGHAVLAERPDECLELIDLFVPLAKRVAA